MRNFTIYLRIDDASPENVRVIERAAKKAAKHLYTAALMVGGRRAAQIRLETDDLFMPAEEIMLADDIEEDNDTAYDKVLNDQDQ